MVVEVERMLEREEVDTELGQLPVAELAVARLVQRWRAMSWCRSNGASGVSMKIVAR